MLSWLRWERLRDETRTRLWPLPVAALVAALALGVGLPALDAAVDDDLPEAVSAYLFGGGAGAARTVLNAIATSLITVTSLTFSLTVLTLQLASSQYSPRLLRTFTRDRFVHRTLALFLGSFVYALTVLRTVRAPEDGQDPFVPQIAVTFGFLLSLASALGLVLFLAHLAREIRVETILRNVHDDTSGSMERVLRDRETAPNPPEPPSGASVHRLLAPSSGFVVGVDPQTLCEAALEADAVVVVDRRVGDALVEGTPVGRAWSLSGAALSDDALAELQDRLSKALETDFERTSRQDVAFGLRQLTDVAVKALSPGINDPTTAVHTLNHATALLCDLVDRDLRPDALLDASGRPRVVVQQRPFAEFLELAVAQPRLYGVQDPFVMKALLELLQAVAWTAGGRRECEAVEAELDRTQQAIEQGDLDVGHREALGAMVQRVRGVLAAGDDRTQHPH